MELTVNRLYELYVVDIVAGTFHHKRTVGRACAESRAGYITSKGGYRVLCVDRKDYMEHNLIWFVATGGWPPVGREVDHRNRIREDNRFENLRIATRGQNCANASLRKDNKAGYRGVHFDKEKKKYCVQVTVNKKTHTKGYYVDRHEAGRVAQEIRTRLVGEFAFDGRE